VLDLGAGPGPSSLALLAAGASRVTAVDRSAPALEIAVELAHRSGRRLETRVADLASGARLPEEPFDFVTAVHTVNELWSDRDAPLASKLQRGDYNFSGSHCARLCWLGRGDIFNPYAFFLAGTMLHYMITGEPKALECCRRNADGLKAVWDWVAKDKPYGGPHYSNSVTGWSILAFCNMYDLTADRKWLDEALKIFRAHVVKKWQEYGPFLHDPTGQIQSQEYVQEDSGYCYSIAPLCELHRRTGDEQIMKLLKEGCEKSFTEGFFDAPRFLADLYAYVGMKTGNKELLEKAADQWASGFPLSKCPPVFVPDNINWSYSAAMTLRAGHVLQYAHWKKPEGK
jgi:SAM-dependent methyltransferase